MFNITTQHNTIQATVTLEDIGVTGMKLAAFSLLPLASSREPSDSGQCVEAGKEWGGGGGEAGRVNATLKVKGCTFFGGAPPVLWAGRGGGSCGVNFEMSPDDTFEESSFASSDLDASARGGGWTGEGVPVNLHGELGIDDFLQEAAQGVDAAGGGGGGGGCGEPRVDGFVCAVAAG